MELPVFPDELKHMLACMDTNEKELSWNIQRSSEKTVVNLTWKVMTKPKSKNPPSEKKFAPSPKAHKSAGKPAVLKKIVASAPSAGLQSQPPSKKKRKSPSRLARDRKRLLQFKEKKKEERSQLHSPKQVNSIDFSCRVIWHKTNLNRRSFLYHYPYDIPIDDTTTASDVKEILIQNLREDTVRHIPDISCISLIQPVGECKHAPYTRWNVEECGQSSTPMWVVPDNLPLTQLYASSVLPDHIYFDICLDEPATDEDMYLSSSEDCDANWETDSAASQSDASLD